MPAVQVEDVELYYETHGQGDPLLLVPGLGGVGAYWMPQIAEFGKYFKVLIHDHRGTGASTRSKIAYSVDQMSRDLIGLMDALRIERAHLIGHSTGGAIGQTIAVEHPDRLLSLVLFSTWTKADPFMKRVFEARKALLTGSGAAAYVKSTSFFLYPDWWINENSEALEKADEAALADFPSTEIAVSRCDAVLNFDRVSQLGQISTPTMVFCAEDDFLTPAYFSRELAERIPGAQLKTIPQGGHACSQTVPEAFNEAILEFLLSRRMAAA